MAHHAPRVFALAVLAVIQSCFMVVRSIGEMRMQT